MSTKPKLDDLITGRIDEPEESLDPVITEPGDESSNEADDSDTFEASPDDEAAQEEQGAASQTDSDPEAASAEDGKVNDADDRQKIPRWVHLKMQANTEKAATAERRASELERRAAEAESVAREWQDWYARQTGDHQQQQSSSAPDLDGFKQEVQQSLQDTLYQERLMRSEADNVRRHGSEAVRHASEWAADRISAGDTALQAVINRSPDPIGDAMKAFKRAQVESELQEFDYDMDAYIASKVGNTPPQPAAGATGAQPVSRQNSTQRMPNDFATAPSARSPGAQSASGGPVPLGDLLKLK